MILPMPSAPLLNRLTDILALSSDQQTKIGEIARKSNAKLQPLVDEQNKAAQALIAAVAKPKSEKSEIQKAVEAAQKAESAVIAAQIEFWTEVKASITDEQAEKLNQMLASSFAGPRLERAPVFSGGRAGGRRGATGYGQTPPGGPPNGGPGPGGPPPGGPPPGAPNPPPEGPMPPAPGE